jgi:hypothetical protein
MPTPLDGPEVLADETQNGHKPAPSYVISHELAEAVVNYLSRQPYAQVFELIAALQQMEQVEQVKS